MTGVTLRVLDSVLCTVLLYLYNLSNRMSQKNIYYSEKYYDNEYEYRCVVFCVFWYRIPYSIAVPHNIVLNVIHTFLNVEDLILFTKL